MIIGNCQPVSVSRRIDAPARVLFAVLADPAQHPSIDGSGMVEQALTLSVISQAGDTFTMRMHNDEMGGYEITNHVVDYQPDRRIAWEPVLPQHPGQKIRQASATAATTSGSMNSPRTAPEPRSSPKPTTAPRRRSGCAEP